MLNRLKKSNNEGFTIIEVMIVLAIAGLIILIVLLAVPALQRNSRNTAIKNDAGAIAGAISTFESDNDGKAPQVTGDVVQSGATVTVGASTTAQAEAKVQGGDNVVVTVAGGVPTTAITPGDIDVHLKEDCNGNPSGRSVAIWYSIETSKGVPTSAPFNNKCVVG
jgi:prepilin-type N-terminal cleavage/methylation domain-containing protein